ncbi:MAG TPA: S1 RNA-binding domain-containing protein [Polyangia bacterium]|nr:S1 RNA-binding domain-containing protein [Polyangia bacterium]
MTRQENEGKEDFASLLAEFEQQHPAPKGRRGPKVGDQVRGRIISIGQEAVFIDLGAKSEGTIDLVELRDQDGRLTVQVGDELEARVAENDERTGCYVLRRTLGRGPEARAELEQAHAHRIPIEGLVTAVNKGGVEVQVAGVRAFCPISQLAERHVEDANAYVGQKLQFLIVRYEPGRGRELNLVLSRRTLLEEETRARAAETRAKLAVGLVLSGTVTTIKDYGAFVDFGGIEGMLHVSEIGFGRISHPREALAVGQRVEVQVLKIEKSDDPRRPEKISLSLKALEKDPWEEVPTRFPEQARVKGTVARVETFGAFIELGPGIEGLLHVSELGEGRKLRHAREALQPGQAVEVRVLGVDRERRRISLGLAGTEAGGEDGGAETPRTHTERPRFGTFGDLLKKGK